MPLALLIVGIIFLTAAVRGKEQTDLLFSTLKDDFTGPNNFLYWGIALWIIGAVGYYKPAKSFSTAFMTLVIIVLFISNKGFFSQFMQQISETQHPHVSDNHSGGGGLFGNLQSGADALKQGANILSGIIGG